MKKYILYFLVLFACFISYAQNSTYNFTAAIREEIGDLNHDGLVDSVTVYMDIVHETRPLRLQVFFAKPNGKFKLVVSSNQIIRAQYPKELNGAFTGRQIPYFFIEKGNLEMVSDIYSGQSTHTFRYQNGNFELIHFFKVVYDGKDTTTETNYDLLTGKFIEQSQLLGSDAYFGTIDKEIIEKELPKIQYFIPFINELY